MHIRADYRLWYPQPKKSVKTMCGRKTDPKFAGIPGVDRMQPPFFKDGRTGWCVACCDAALDQMNKIVVSKIDEVLYDDFYLPAMNVCANQILAASYST